jgi:hypothetical protein
MQGLTRAAAKPMQEGSMRFFSWRRRKASAGGEANDADGAELSAPQPYEGEVREYYETRAQAYYAAFESNRAARQDAIRRSAEALDAGPIVVTSFNWGYRQLVHNWAASCDRYAIDCRRFTLLFPTDARAEAFAKDLGFVTYFDAVSYGELPEKAHEKFGDSSYRKSLFAKIASTQDALATGRDLLRQDADLVWFRDPRPGLAARAAEEDLHYLFMNDGPNPMHAPLHYNSGFVFIRGDDLARAAWKEVFSSYARMLHCGSEQKIVNGIISKLTPRGVRHARLPDDTFVNGHVISEIINNGGTLPESPAVVHVSWTANIDKKLEHLQRFGLWYL